MEDTGSSLCSDSEADSAMSFSVQDESDKFQWWKQRPEFEVLTGDEFELCPDLALACLVHFERDGRLDGGSIDDKAEWCISNEGNSDLVSQILESASPPTSVVRDALEEKEEEVQNTRKRLDAHKKQIQLHHYMRPTFESRQDNNLEGELDRVWANFQNNNTEDLKAKDFLNFQDLATLLEVRLNVGRL